MADSAEQQRRWERRAPTHSVRVSAETEELATASGEALNLSEGGACLALQTSDIFLANPDGTPVQGQFQVWLAPRTFQVGVRLDMDWAE